MGKIFLVPKEQETIFSDASKKGWGAHLGPLEIGGRWCLEERIQHINVLELQAAFLAIKALLPKIDKPHVQFAIDNQTAVTYINKIRWNPLTSTFILSNRTMAFCSENEPISVSSLCAGNKKLHSRQEVKSVQRLTRVDAKLPGVSTDFTQNAWVRSRSVCLQNKSPIDSFCQLETRARCDNMRCFQFELGPHERLPFSTFVCLIHRCIKKIQLDQAECILITPVWKSRPWYPVILSLLADRLLLLPKDSKLLQLPGTDKVHPLCSQKNFRLAAWPLSGKKYQNRGFLRRCQRYTAGLMETKNYLSV